MYKWCIAILIMADLGISSCGRFVAYKYDLGKKFSFENKKQFSDYVVKQTGFFADDIYYADKAGYYSLMNEMQNANREGILWGFYNGKQPYIKIDSSELAKLYCKQRIQDLAGAFFTDGKLPEPYLTDSAVIQSFHLKKLSDNSDLQWSDFSSKRMIMLQFATAYGKYYNDLYTNIASPEFDKTKSGKIIIVCLDPVYQLP